MAPRRTLVREVNPHLICVLCRGYFIEATTITECLHSFCRSCLVKYLGTSKFCPICDVQLHKNNPLLSVRCDPTLQQLVYKLIPGLYANEMARRRKYYSELGGPSSDPDCGEYPVGDAYFSPEDSISLSLEFTTTSPGKDEESGGSDAEDSPVDKQGGLHRRYLQCPAAVTMSHLQKFLRMKYGFSHEVKVDIIYEGEVLSDEFSLMDVAYTFNWQRTAPMRFKFRLLQKSDVPSKGCGIEKTKKPVEVKDDEIVQKPIAEAKVFAFAHVPAKTNSPLQKNSHCQTAALKSTEEPKTVPVQKQEPKDIKSTKEPSQEIVIPKEEKGSRVPASKEGKELKSLKDLKPRNSPTFEKIAEKNGSGASVKRPHQNDRMDDSYVETKKLKIILEPLPTILMQEKKKSVPVKPEVIKAQPVDSKPHTSSKDSEKRHETKKQMIYAPEKTIAKEIPKREVEKAKSKEPVVPVVAEEEEEDEEPNYMDDIIQEDEYDDDDGEDRLHISPPEEDMVIEEKVDPSEDVEKEEMDTQVGAEIEERDERISERELAKYARSEERRKEKKRNKKAKHHHHRHHDRKRDSPPIATILHSPDNDLKLKFKLTNTNTKPKYTIMDNNDSKRDYNCHSSPKHQEKYDREFKNKAKEPVIEVPKKQPSPVINNNYNNLNNNNNLLLKAAHVEPEKMVETGSKERSFQLKISKQKVTRSASPAPKAASPKMTAPVQNKPCPVPSPLLNSSPKPKPQSPQQLPIIKQNGATPVKTETIKMPPSSITVSKITAAEKAHMEQQKLLMNRNNSLGLDSKRPSLEIMLVNAPKKAGDSSVVESKPVEVKKVMRPTPPSIPLSRLKNFGSKGSPPPLVLANKSMSANDENGALDLSGKSSRKSPDMDSMRNLVMLSNTAERMMSSLEPLKIPIPPNIGMGMKSGFQQGAPRTMKPGPNQTVRQIPNPSALMFRQHALNSQRSVPPSLPINSLRKMETMAKNINLEKVAAGLSVKAAVEAGYHPK